MGPQLLHTSLLWQPIWSLPTVYTGADASGQYWTPIPAPLPPPTIPPRNLYSTTNNPSRAKRIYPRLRAKTGPRQPWKEQQGSPSSLRSLQRAKSSLISSEFATKYNNITNTEIFNLSTYILTPTEKIVLGLGTKFIPLPKTTSLDLITNTHTSIDALHRRLRLSFFFSTPSLFSTTTPAIANKVQWHPPPHPVDPLLSSFITQLKDNSSTHITNSRSFFSPLDNLLLTTLKNLQRQKHITFKPADKNLGLVILNTIDYKEMCLKHLNDAETYKVITDYDTSIVYTKLIDILKKHGQFYNNTRSQTQSLLAKSLLQYHNTDTPSRISVFYCLPKVHKTIIPPIPGRPIVSSSGSITYHTSKYLDKELQPVLKLLHTVCTSSRHILRDMNNKTFPENSVIMCADVTALYPNIPIELGLKTVRSVLTDLNIFTVKKLNFLMDLLQWVLTNNYVTFNNTIYLQLKGTAMGTPTAVVYSNIFLYGIEKRILHTYLPHYYTRYIDDVFSVFPSDTNANGFIEEFNSFCPSIKFEAVTVGRSGVMLDLELTLNHQANPPLDSVTHKLYQKPRNVYQYIPPSSEHKQSLFKNIILQEFKRYSLASTTLSDYTSITTSFRQRLLVRGYDAALIDSILLEVPTRTTLFDNLITSLNTSKPTEYIPKPPLVTLCVPRLDPPIPWGTLFHIPDTISTHPSYTSNYSSHVTTIGSKNPPTIGSYIIRSKYVDPT